MVSLLFLFPVVAVFSLTPAYFISAHASEAIPSDRNDLEKLFVGLMNAQDVMVSIFVFAGFFSKSACLSFTL